MTRGCRHKGPSVSELKPVSNRQSGDQLSCCLKEILMLANCHRINSARGICFVMLLLHKRGHRRVTTTQHCCNAPLQQQKKKNSLCHSTSLHSLTEVVSFPSIQWFYGQRRCRNRCFKLQCFFSLAAFLQTSQQHYRVIKSVESVAHWWRSGPVGVSFVCFDRTEKTEKTAIGKQPGGRDQPR